MRLSHYKFTYLLMVILLFLSSYSQAQGNAWILIDNFEQINSAQTWTKADTKNDTSLKSQLKKIL